MLTLPLIAAGSWRRPLGLAARRDPLRDAARRCRCSAICRLGRHRLGLYRRLRGRDGLGLGDAKLLAAAGAWLGLASLPWVVLAAALLGLVLALLRAGPLRAETAVPFGPPLALAFWVMFLLASA